MSTTTAGRLSTLFRSPPAPRVMCMCVLTSLEGQVLGPDGTRTPARHSGGLFLATRSDWRPAPSPSHSPSPAIIAMPVSSCLRRRAGRGSKAGFDSGIRLGAGRVRCRRGRAIAKSTTRDAMRRGPTMRCMYACVRVGEVRPVLARHVVWPASSGSSGMLTALSI